MFVAPPEQLVMKKRSENALNKSKDTLVTELKQQGAAALGKATTRAARRRMARGFHAFATTAHRDALNSLASMNATLSNKLAASESELDRIQAVLRATQDEVHNMSTISHSAEDRLVALKHTNDELLRTNRELVSTKNDLLADINTLTHKNNENGVLVGTLQIQIDNLREQVSRGKRAAGGSGGLGALAAFAALHSRASSDALLIGYVFQCWKDVHLRSVVTALIKGGGDEEGAPKLWGLEAHMDGSHCLAQRAALWDAAAGALRSLGERGDEATLDGEVPETLHTGAAPTEQHSPHVAVAPASSACALLPHTTAHATGVADIVVGGTADVEAQFSNAVGGLEVEMKDHESPESAFIAYVEMHTRRRKPGLSTSSDNSVEIDSASFESALKSLRKDINGIRARAASRELFQTFVNTLASSEGKIIARHTASGSRGGPRRWRFAVIRACTRVDVRTLLLQGVTTGATSAPSWSSGSIGWFEHTGLTARVSCGEAFSGMRLRASSHSGPSTTWTPW